MSANVNSVEVLVASDEAVVDNLCWYFSEGVR